MAGQSDDSFWASDAVSALKAKVEAVRQAEAAVQARMKELGEERDSLEDWSKRLTDREQVLARAEEDLARRKLGLEDGKSELERAQTGLAQGQERLAANEARIREWAQSVQAAEQQVNALRDELRSRQAEVAMKVAQFHDRIVALAKREEALADREAAVAETLQRLKKVGDSVVTREASLSSQVRALADLQTEWLGAVRRREEEIAKVLASLESAGPRGTEGAQMSALIDELQREVAKIAAQREGLVARERKLAEFEQGMMSVMGAVSRPDAPAVSLSPPVIVVEPPAPEAKPAPPSPAPASPPAAPAGPPPSPKAVRALALEKMSRVVELARELQSSGGDKDRIVEALGDIKKVYEAKDWERLDSLCDGALEKLATLKAETP